MVDADLSRRPRKGPRRPRKRGAPSPEPSGVVVAAAGMPVARCALAGTRPIRSASSSLRPLADGEGLAGFEQRLEFGQDARPAFADALEHGVLEDLVQPVRLPLALPDLRLSTSPGSASHRP